MLYTSSLCSSFGSGASLSSIPEVAAPSAPPMALLADGSLLTGVAMEGASPPVSCRSLYFWAGGQGLQHRHTVAVAQNPDASPKMRPMIGTRSYGHTLLFLAFATAASALAAAW